MKCSSVLYPVLTASLFAFASAQQKIMDNNLGPALPPVGPDGPPTAQPGQQPGSDSVILTDVMGRDRSINIFAGFTRDIDTVDKRLADGNSNTTVLAPLNSAIVALPRKPWEDARDYQALGADAYEGPDGEDKAHRNLRRFVEEHVVIESPWNEGDKVETMAGDKVWWEKKDGKTFVSFMAELDKPDLTSLQIQPGNIEVSSVGSKVANGEVWILKGTRNYA
jgi:hypothetical protein